MKLVRLFRTLHDALEAHLPDVADESERHEALEYLRGVKTLLATVVDAEDSNIIAFDDYLIQRRIDAAVHETRQRQLAAAQRFVQPYGVDEFGWGIYGEID